MSYCRWSDSDLYIYPSIGGGIVCMGATADSADVEGDHYFSTPSRAAMIAHVEEHIAAGACVDDDVIERLRAEIETLGDEAKGAP